MTIWLYRHGKTAANEARQYCGSTDLPLTGGGRNALRPLALPLGLEYISSGMRRCNETLELLTGQTVYRTEPRLREIDFGDFECRTYEELKENPAYQAWITGDPEISAPPNGESAWEMKERVMEAFSELIRAGRDCFVVTHGGVIAAIMAWLFPGEDKHLYSWQPAPGEGYLLTIENGHATHKKA